MRINLKRKEDVQKKEKSFKNFLQNLKEIKSLQTYIRERAGNA